MFTLLRPDGLSCSVPIESGTLSGLLHKAFPSSDPVVRGAPPLAPPFDHDRDLLLYLPGSEEAVAKGGLGDAVEDTALQGGDTIRIEFSSIYEARMTLLERGVVSLTTEEAVSSANSGDVEKLGLYLTALSDDLQCVLSASESCSFWRKILASPLPKEEKVVVIDTHIPSSSEKGFFITDVIPHLCGVLSDEEVLGLAEALVAKGAEDGVLPVHDNFKATCGVPALLAMFCEAYVRYFGGRTQLTSVLSGSADFGGGSECSSEEGGESVLHHYCKFEETAEGVATKMFRTFFANGADTAERDECGRTALQLCIESGNFSTTHSFLSASREEGTKLKQILSDKSIDGFTALHFATAGQHIHTSNSSKSVSITLIRALLEGGADVNARSDAGITPLHLLCAAHCVPDLYELEGVEDLLCSGDNGGDMCESLEVLVAAGAEVDAQCDKGMTALHFAEGSAATSVTTALLHHGADATKRNVQGKTPADLRHLHDTAALIIKSARKGQKRGYQGAEGEGSSEDEESSERPSKRPRV